MTPSNRLALSSSRAFPKLLRFRKAISRPAPISKEPSAASADGLSKLTGTLERPKVAEVMTAGDFFTC